MTAPKKLLEELHDQVGRQLLSRIKSGEATASEFAQAIKFLKDNGIEAIPSPSNALGALEESLSSRLPFTDPDSPVTYQ